MKKQNNDNVINNEIMNMKNERRHMNNSNGQNDNMQKYEQIQ